MKDELLNSLTEMLMDALRNGDKVQINASFTSAILKLATEVDKLKEVA